jgi:hypothetical protein
MSSPSSYSYRVVEDPAVVAARLEAQALAVAKSRVESALARLSRLEVEASALREHYGEQIGEVRAPKVTPKGRSEEVASLATQLESQAAMAEKRLEQERDAAHRSAFLAQLRAADAVGEEAASSLTRLLEAAKASDEKDGGSPGPSRNKSGDRFAQDCARVFSRLRADVPETLREQAERTLETALRAVGSERASLLLDRLREAVTTANRKAEERKRRCESTDVMLTSLGDLAASDSSRLRELLVRERSEGRPLAELYGLVESARVTERQKDERERREADRKHVIAALHGAFSDLGYEVQGDFDVALAAQRPAYTRCSQWGDHAVRVLLDEESHELRLHVVGDESAPRSESSDKKCEEKLCGDREAFSRALASRGVDIAVKELAEPGSVPLARVGLSDVGFRSRRRAQARAQGQSQ